MNTHARAATRPSMPGLASAAPGPGFDPLAELLVAPLERPPTLSPVNLRTLSPFTRALLVTDGTVTKFIEAYTMEPVDVTRLAQELRELKADHEWLDAPAGTQVLARQVVLRGRHRGALYAYAPSLMVTERLPADVQAGLNVDGGSIGRIMLDSKIETRREILWYGREPADDLPAEVRRATGGFVISRTYRVILGGRPIMLISEKFPVTSLDTDLLPAHH